MRTQRIISPRLSRLHSIQLTCHQALSHPQTLSFRVVSSPTQTLTVIESERTISSSLSTQAGLVTALPTSSAMATWHSTIKALAPTIYHQLSPSASVNALSTSTKSIINSSARQSPTSLRSSQKTSTLHVLYGRTSSMTRPRLASSPTYLVTCPHATTQRSSNAKSPSSARCLMTSPPVWRRPLESRGMMESPTYGSTAHTMVSLSSDYDIFMLGLKLTLIQAWLRTPSSITPMA